MQVEPRDEAGHPGSVLARRLIEAVEARVRTGVSYAEIARAASMAPQQLANLKAAVAADPEHVIKSDVAERLARAVGCEVLVVPSPEGGRS